MKVPIHEKKRGELLAEIQEIHVSVLGNLVTIQLSVRDAYEAQSLCDDIEGLLKAGRTVVLQGNGPKKVKAP